MDNEKREKRAKSLSAMGLVKRNGSEFLVSTPSLRGKQTSYRVWRDSETGKVMCDCLEFEDEFPKHADFRCEHILAVKYALVGKEIKEEKKDAETAQETPETTSVIDLMERVLGFQLHDYQKVILNTLEKCEKIKVFLSWQELKELNVKQEFPREQKTETQFDKPSNPIARSLSDLITAKQLGMIRAICRELGFDVEAECNDFYQCRTDELSKRAASSFIQHLQEIQKGGL